MNLNEKRKLSKPEAASTIQKAYRKYRASKHSLESDVTNKKIQRNIKDKKTNKPKVLSLFNTARNRILRFQT